MYSKFISQICLIPNVMLLHLGIKYLPEHITDLVINKINYNYIYRNCSYKQIFFNLSYQSLKKKTAVNYF